MAAARAAYIAGFATTSNLQAGHEYGIPTSGTSAHAFTLVHDDERQAFAAQLDALGPDTTLLVDTYDVAAAVAAAVEVAGPRLGAVRIDSGDLAVTAREVRAQLDALGAPADPDRADRRPGGALHRRAGRGPGRRLRRRHLAGHRVGRADRRPGLQARRPGRRPTASRWCRWPSARWASRRGAAASGRRASSAPTGDGGRRAHHRHPGREPRADEPPGTRRALLQLLVRDGEIIGGEPLEAARARHRAAVAELPAHARQLSRGYPAIPTTFSPSRDEPGWD